MPSIVISVTDEQFEWLRKKGAGFSTDTYAPEVAHEILQDAIKALIHGEAQQATGSQEIVLLGDWGDDS